jgi:hypothetical protein
MDNLDDSKISPDENLDKPIPFDDDDTSVMNVSHSPLDLGGGATVEMPKAEAAPQPVKLTKKKPAEEVVSTERITGVKTFFTKLHAGAIDFLDGQITRWLKENPGITVKRTNVVTGEVQGKKTEPNIVITVWY